MTERACAKQDAIIRGELRVKIRIGLPTAQSGPFAEGIRNAWSAAGRTGEPRLAALTYFRSAMTPRRRPAATFSITTVSPETSRGGSLTLPIDRCPNCVMWPRGSRMQDSPSCISIQRSPELTRSTALLTPYSEQQS